MNNIILSKIKPSAAENLGIAVRVGMKLYFAEVGNGLVSHVE